MGHPKKKRKKYSKPMHPWQKGRIDQERQILNDYGLKNKKEIWKMESKLRTFKYQTKKIIAGGDNEQSKKEGEALIEKLFRLGLLSKTARFEEVLGLGINNILDRRLQTLVFKKGLAKSVKQARQFITHGHISMDGKKITIPSYFVLKDQEDKLSFLPGSTLADAEHPERIVKKVEIKTQIELPVKEESKEGGKKLKKANEKKGSDSAQEGQEEKNKEESLKEEKIEESAAEKKEGLKAEEDEEEKDLVIKESKKIKEKLLEVKK